MINYIRKTGLLFLPVLLAITSCYPEEYENAADLDVVQTQYDINLDAAILDEIANQMDAAGYTRLTEQDTTDEDKMNRAVVVLATRSLETYSGYYYDYYYSGYDYWGNYYGLNYYNPGYQAVDDQNGQVVYPVRWMAVMNGIAERSAENTEQRTRDGIIQASLK